MLRHGQHQLGELHVGPDDALILHEPIEGRSEKGTVRHNHLQNTIYMKIPQLIKTLNIEKCYMDSTVYFGGALQFISSYILRITFGTSVYNTVLF